MRRPPFAWRAWLAAVIVVAILIWSALGTGFSARALAEGFPQIGAYFARLIPSSGHPWPADTLPKITQKLIETLRIAFAASVFGALLALPFALIGARTLAPTRLVYNFGRGLLNLIRTVPDLVLATLLVVAFKPGPTAGFLALLLFSFGVVAKLLCDTVETIDPGPMESITAAGGTRLQRAVRAVLPQIRADFAAYTLYSFEINVRAAAVLGFVGAGGIGMILQTATTLMNYAQVGLIVAVTFIAVFLIDSFSTWLRSRLV